MEVLFQIWKIGPNFLQAMHNAPNSQPPSQRVPTSSLQPTNQATVEPQVAMRADTGASLQEKKDSKALAPHFSTALFPTPYTRGSLDHLLQLFSIYLAASSIL